MAVFSEHDFNLCDIPVPDNYPQSQTHAGVAPINGYVILTSSPFPSITEKVALRYLKAIIRKVSYGRFCKLVRGESYENPCLYISDAGKPTEFRLMQTRPLMEQPDPYYGYPSFNSDPDLFVENETIYVINRMIFRTRLTPGRNRDEYMIRHYFIKGILDNGRFKYLSTRLIYESDDLSVSPCLTKFRNGYIMTNLYTNCYNDGESFEGLRYVSGDTIESVTSRHDWMDISVDTSKYLPWHMSLFVHEEKLYTIVACVKRGEDHRCYQMLGVFSDGLTKLRIYDTPLCNYNSYRGSAYVSNDGIFHLYSTTVNEKIRGGKSVDGREVIYASMPFKELLKKIL